ncbi:MAG: UvrD-helicase domain-containing protein, partial [Cetobacterium sp.]
MAIEKIKDCLNEKKCFYLKAAAGSGKTYTLIQSLKYILENKKGLLKSKSIACITYTNIAKKEIFERIDFHEQIEVYTIHEFFWKIIKNYQKELKKIVELKLDTDEKKEAFKDVKKIQYKEYIKYEKGVISHNDILVISKELFERYGSKLSKIVSSKYSYIFVDEYQDTDKKILDILCNNLSLTDSLIGLFGDPVQKIYRGELYNIESHCNFIEIKKKENHRSGKKIVELLNKLRDDIDQEAKKSFLGKIKFYYNPENICIDVFLKKDFAGEDLKERKKLYLVHRRIAKENNYEEFFELLNKEKQIDYFIDNSKNRENSLANYLYLIEDCCNYYTNDHAQKILKTLNYKIFKNEDKKILRDFFIELIEMKENKTIKEVIDFIKDKKVIESLDIDENNLKLYNLL